MAEKEPGSKAVKQEKLELIKTREQWIESAAYLGAERHEVAGALFNVNEKIKESDVRKRIKVYRGGDE